MAAPASRRPQSTNRTFRTAAGGALASALLFAAGSMAQDQRTPDAPEAPVATAAALAPTAPARPRAAPAPRIPVALQKVGEARLKVFVWSIYDSRLYTPSGEYREGERPLKLEIEYLRDIKRDALADRTLQEWQAMGRDHPRQEAWVEALRGLWRDIEANDVVTLELDEQNIARFTHNGEILGQIDDPAFGQHFVDIWLSPECTRPELRLALLGQDD